MPRNDPAEPGDRLLDRYWDEVARGSSAPPAGLDAEVAATVRRLHDLDDALGPDPAYANHLWEDLMQSTAIPQPVRPRLAPTPRSMGERALPEPQPSQPLGLSSPRWSAGQFAAAVMVVVTLAVGYLAYRLAVPSPERRGEGTFAAIQGESTGHPLVGSWTVGTTGGAEADPPLLITFGADGTVLASDIAGHTGHGAWVATGEDTANFAYVAVDVSANGTIDATTYIDGSVKVDPTGSGWTGTYSLARALAGRDEASEASPDTSVEATRITADGTNSADPAPEPGEPGYAPATPTA